MEVSKWKLSSSTMRCCFVCVLHVLFVLISGAPDGWKSCGRNITLNGTALLSSPGYPTPSKGGITCTWVVTSRHKVFVQGVTVSVGPELKDCMKGSLQIFDGCDSDRFLVEEICSSRYKSVDHHQGFMWLSSSTCITVKYSSGLGSSNKFHISVTETSVTCGGVLRNRNNNHSFGGSLPFDTEIRECVWIIAVKKGKIELVFTEKFLVSSRGQDCKEDFVKVQDGRYSSSPLLGTYCGTSRPYPVYSSGRYLRVTLHGSTRRLATRRCFGAVYNVVDSKPKPLTGICDEDIDLHSPGGKFQTPRYLDQYPAGLRCIWKIKVAENSKITLKFQHFDVEGDSQECPDNSDYAKVQDGLASWSPVIGRYCGSVIPPAITSESNKLRVEFQSNLQYAGRGFDAVYTVDDGTEDLETRNHFTGIMIGSTCGIIFIVLSVLAVFHTRKLRIRRALSRRSDVASTISLDGHQANAPPSYETVMASPDLFPSNSRPQSRGYSSVPHLHREISHLLGGDAESDDEELPPYPGLPHRDGTVEFLPERPSRERRTSGSKKRHDSESDNPFQISAVWYRRWPASAASSYNVGHDLEGSTLERRDSSKVRTRPGLEGLDTTSSFVTDV